MTERDLFEQVEARIRNRLLAEVYVLLQGKTVTLGTLHEAFGIDRSQLSKLARAVQEDDIA